MTRHNRRRHLVQVRGPRPMYVLAGLPRSTIRRAVERLQQLRPEAIVQGLPSATDDGTLYPRVLINQLIRSVGQFAIRRRINGPAQPPAPATITLFYVPSHDDERLLDAFDFAIMSEPLTSLVSRDETQQQRRHSMDAIEAALIDATAPEAPVRQAISEVVRRLGRQTHNEGLLLPPRNFIVGDHDLSPTFRALRQCERPWTDRFEELGPTALTHDDIARIPAEKTRRAFVDSRGLAFLLAHPAAYDGPAREVDESDTVAPIMSVLRSLYRFGGALPPGIHHDAQRCDGSALAGAIMHCDRDGRISADGDYANIYPNDFVRVDQKTKAE